MRLFRLGLEGGGTGAYWTQNRAQGRGYILDSQSITGYRQILWTPINLPDLPACLFGPKWQGGDHQNSTTIALIQTLGTLSAQAHCQHVAILRKSDVIALLANKKTHLKSVLHCWMAFKWRILQTCGCTMLVIDTDTHSKCTNGVLFHLYTL